MGVTLGLWGLVPADQHGSWATMPHGSLWGLRGGSLCGRVHLKPYRFGDLCPVELGRPQEQLKLALRARGRHFAPRSKLKVTGPTWCRSLWI